MTREPDPDGLSLPLHHLSASDPDAEERQYDASMEGLLSEAPVIEKTPKPRSTEFLTGLRGLASLLVYIYHHLSWFYGPEDDFINGYGADPIIPKARQPQPNAPPNYYLCQLPFIRVFFTGGNAGVHTFFVLSGFVLSISTFRKLASPQHAAYNSGETKSIYRSLLSSIIRRPARLYIPTIGVSFVFALCMHLPFGLAPSLPWPSPESSLWTEMVRWVSETAWLLNPFEPHSVLTHWYIYNPPAYTMPIEWLGSMVVFVGLGIAVAASSRLGHGAAVVRTVMFVLAGIFFLSTYQWAMGCFILGMLLAMNEVSHLDDHILAKRFSPRTQAVFYYMVFLTGWYLLCEPASMEVPVQTPGYRLLTFLIPPNYYGKEYWRWLHTWGAAFMVYGILKINILQRFFDTRALRYLGKTSFALYLVHGPLLWTLSDRVYRLFGSTRMPELSLWIDNKLEVPDVGIHGFSSRFLVAQVFILPLNLAAAHVGTLLLDEPSVTLGKWMTVKLGIDAKR